MKSQLLKDHCCLFIFFPFCFYKRFNALLILNQLFYPWGKYWGKDLFYFSCLSLFIDIFFLSFFASLCFPFPVCHWFLLPNHMLFCYTFIPLLYWFLVQFCFPKIAPWRGGDEKNKRCTIEHWFTNLADLENHMRYFRDLQIPDLFQRQIQWG